MTGPRLLVLSSLFPSDAQPRAGLFIRERMFRVARHCPMVVVAPQPWFPLQSLIRLWRPHYRPMARRFEVMQGIEVHRPRFLCIPGLLKQADGLFMALCSYFTVRKLARRNAVNVLDVHFGYPDGAAGRLLARWLKLPMVLTLRGKESDLARTSVAGPMCKAIVAANEIVTVSSVLRDVALAMGADPGRVTVIGNGVDLARFAPLPKDGARRELGLPLDAEVLVSVANLVEGKGIHRVIECLPNLVARHPGLHYVVAGDATPYGDMSAELQMQVAQLGLQDRVHFLGGMQPDRLKVPLSAADIFVLATRYEGWANVFLEAMACGLPVVTTRVGGNSEVVSLPSVGTLVEFGDCAALTAAIDEALSRRWDRSRILEYARSNGWDQRIPAVLDVLRRALQRCAPAQPHGICTGDGGACDCIEGRNP
jgi:teichuronic acid biosynthesis glycosyltransferase TuaC